MKSYENRRKEIVAELEALDKSYEKTLKRSTHLRAVLDLKPKIEFEDRYGSEYGGYKIGGQGRTTSFLILTSKHGIESSEEVIKVTQLKEIEQSLKNVEDLPRYLAGKDEPGSYYLKGMMRSIWRWILENHKEPQ